VGPLYEVLTELLARRKLNWSDKAVNAFEGVKKEIEKCPTLFFVDELAPITLQTDASDYGIGGYLFQTVVGEERPIMFLSKAFTRPQLRWSPFEKEAYAIIFCIKKLDYLLRDSKFTLQTDHRNLLFLKEGSDAKVVRWNMAVSEYDFNLEHIAGKSNVVADAMSRLMQNPKDQIIEDIKNDQSPVARSNLFALLNVVDIPNDKYRIISQFHNSQTGHFGFNNTVRLLYEKGHRWRYIRSHVRKFLKDCPICQKMSPLLSTVSAMRFTAASYEPFARITMDSIGPLPTSEEGYKFILVVIDCFTRTLELYPCKSTDAEEAAQYLIEFISRYGTPDQVLSDRGSQFVNSVIDTALQTLGVHHLLSAANSKQETAIVERANKEVLRFLIPMVYEAKSNEKWPQYIPLIRRILMAHPHASTGIAPAMLLYGETVQLERGVYPEAEIPEGTESHSQETTTSSRLDKSWILKSQEKQRELLQIAEQQQRKVDAENLALRTANSDPVTEFEIGAYVLVLYKDQHMRGKGRPPNKLMTLKRGPFRVIGSEGNHYKVQSLAHDNIENVHVTELQPFRFDANHTDPFEVSLGDEQEFVVERIVRHEKRPSPLAHVKREQLFLFVKWEGYDEAANSWEPIAGLYHLPLVRDYLRAHKLASYIPASVRDDDEKNLRPRRRRSN
jgi:transposase InsO family protein